MPTNYGSSATEERVVEMRIDNKQFERGAKTTIDTLAKLEKALNIKSKTDAIDALADSVSKFDATPMSDSFEAVYGNISSKGVLIKRLIENLTDDIYNFGKKTIKELTIDQVSAGMNKYTQLAESTQTIMAATQDSEMFAGKNEEERLAVINGYLDQLLWYSDETSYAFTDMTSNLGKFLAAGVELDDAVNAIMGVASWGASAGAKPAEVGRAMYNISQAMGAGSMKVVDWKSIENANMATLAFKENVLSIAAEMGKIKIWDKDDFSEWRYGMEDAKKEADLFTAKSFREGLSEGWFDTDVMTEVFKRYGEFADRLYEVTQNTGLETNEALEILDQLRDTDSEVDWDSLSKWTGVAVDELKVLFNALNEVEWAYSEQGFRMGQEYKTFADVIDYTKDAVSSGWMQTFKYIFGDFLEAKELWSYVGDLFDNIFVSSSRFRNEVLKIWHGLGGRDNLITAFENTVTAISNIITPIKNFVSAGILRILGYDFKGAQKPAAFLAEKLKDLTDRLANLTGRIADLTSGKMSLLEFIKSLGLVATPIVAVATAFGLLAAKSAAIKTALGVLNTAKLALTTLSSPIGLISLGITGLILAFKNWDKIKKTVSTTWTAIKGIFAEGKGDLKKDIENIKNYFLSVLPEGITKRIEAFKAAISSAKEYIKGFIPADVLARFETFKTNLTGLKNIILQFITGGNTRSAIDPNRNIFTRILYYFDIIKTAYYGLKSGNMSISDLISSIFDFSSFNERLETFKTNLIGLKDYLLGFIPVDVLTRFENFKTGLTGIKDAIIGFFTGNKVKPASLTDAVSAMLGLKTWAETSGTTIENASEAITNMASGVINSLMLPSDVEYKRSVLDFIIEKFEFIRSKIGEWKANAKNLGGFLGNMFSDFIGLLAQIKWTDVWNTIKTSFSDFFTPVKEAIAKLFGKSVDDGLTKAITRSGVGLPKPTLKEWISNLLHFDTIKDWLISIIPFSTEGLLENLPSINWEQVLMKVLNIGSAFAGLKALNGIGNVENSLAKMFKNFAGIDFNKFLENLSSPAGALTKAIEVFTDENKGFPGLFASIKDTLKSGKFRIEHKQIDSFGTTVLKLAASIAILAGVVYILSKMNVDDAKKALTILGAIAGGLLVFGGLAKLFKIDGRPIFLMAAALTVLMVPLYILSKMPWNSILKGGAAIAILMFELSIFSRLAGKGMSKDNTLPFIKMAFALLVLTYPLQRLAKLSWNELIRGVVGIGILLAELSLSMRLMGKGLDKSSKAPLLKMAVAVLILALAVKQFAKLSWEDLAKGLLGVVVMIGSIAVAMRLMKKSSVKGLISLAIAVGVLTIAMKAIAKMSWDELLKGVIGIGVILGLFALVLSSASKLSFGNSFSAILLLAAMMAAIVIGFKYLTDQNTDFNNLIKFVGSLALVMVSFGYMMKAMDKVSFGSGMKTLGMFAIFIVAFGGILAGLGWLESQFEGLTKFIHDGADMFAAFGEAIGGFIGGILGGIGSALFGDFNLPQLGTDLSTFMENVSGFTEGAKNIDTSIGSKIGALTGAIMAIAGTEFVSAVAGLFLGEDTTVEAFTKDIIGLATGLSAYSAIIALLPKSAEANNQRALTIATGLNNLINSLAKEGGLMSWLEGQPNVLGFKVSIGYIADGLVEYATKISGITKLASIADIAMATLAAKGLAELENALPKEGGALQTLLGSQNLSGFGDGVASVATGLAAYAEAIGNISNDLSDADIETAERAASGLNALQSSLPETGGWVQSIIGWKDLKGFGEGIEKVGDGLKSYIIAITGIGNEDHKDDIKQASSVASGLADLQSKMPETGGKLQDWFGYQNLSTFGNSLFDLGLGLLKYGIAIQGLKDYATDEDYKVAKKAAQGLSDLQSSLPSTGGTLQHWLGDKNLDTFGAQLQTLGKGLYDYATAVNGISSAATDDDLEKASSIADNLNALNTKLPLTGDGFLQSLIGEKSLGNFATNVGELGTGLKKFADSIKGIDESKAESAITVLGSINDFVTQLDPTGGLFQKIADFFGGDQYTTLLGMTESMVTVGTNLKTFSESMKDIKTEDVGAATTMVDELDAFVDSLDKSGGIGDKIAKFITGDQWKNLQDTVDNMSLFGTQFKTFSDGIKGATKADSNFTTAKKIVEDFIALGSAYTDPDGQSMYMNAYTKALEVPQALATGLNENAYLFYDELTKLATNATKNYDAMATDAHSAGWNVSVGVAQGIYDASYQVSNAMQELADAVSVTFTTSLAIASPSRKMAALAAFIPAGIAQGINQNESEAIESIALLGDSLILAMQQAMYDVGMIADGNYSITPTITPVVDMASAQSAGAAFEKIFSDASVKSIFSGIEVDGASIIHSIQSKDIVTEIRSINDHLSELDNNIQGLQLVLDTGSLVGGIATKMDTRLGVMAARKGRGN